MSESREQFTTSHDARAPMNAKRVTNPETFRFPETSLRASEPGGRPIHPLGGALQVPWSHTPLTQSAEDWHPSPAMHRGAQAPREPASPCGVPLAPPVPTEDVASIEGGCPVVASPPSSGAFASDLLAEASVSADDASGPEGGPLPSRCLSSTEHAEGATRTRDRVSPARSPHFRS
jgi:hypothetical protein